MSAAGAGVGGHELLLLDGLVTIQGNQCVSEEICRVLGAIVNIQAFISPLSKWTPPSESQSMGHHNCVAA